MGFLVRATPMNTAPRAGSRIVRPCSSGPARSGLVRHCAVSGREAVISGRQAGHAGGEHAVAGGAYRDGGGGAASDAEPLPRPLQRPGGLVERDDGEGRVGAAPGVHARAVRGDDDRGAVPVCVSWPGIEAGPLLAAGAGVVRDSGHVLVALAGHEYLRVAGRDVVRDGGVAVVLVRRVPELP